MVEPGPIPEVGPSTQLLRSQFRMASAQWEKEQLGAAAQALEQGKGGWQAREYRIAVAAKGTWRRASSNKLWILLPPKSLTVSFRVLSFSFISRAHCAMHQLLHMLHEQFPVRRFALLERPDLAASMARHLV